MAVKEVKVCDICGQLELPGIGSFVDIAIGNENHEACNSCKTRIIGLIDRIKNPKERKPRKAKE